MRDSKADGKEKRGGVDVEEGSWYKRHLRNSVSIGFWLFLVRRFYWGDD